MSAPPRPEAQRTIKPFTNGMRSPVIAPLTRFLLGVPLFLLSTRTDRFFAWTIGVPLTAAVLGANYWTSAWVAVLASRERIWANGRISISLPVVFAPLTTAATFIHLDQFHFDTFFGWFWVLAYGIYPPMLALLLWRQLRTPGVDPPRGDPLPLWVRLVFGAHAVLLIPLGVIMFVSPSTAAHLWPWPLTPLTSQVLSAWVLALGVGAAHAIYENDVRRVRVALLAYPVLVGLHAISLARFPHDLDWGHPGAVVYLAYLASALVLGGFGVASLRREGRASAAATA